MPLNSMSNLQANDDSVFDDDDQEMETDEMGTNENLSIEEEKPLSKYKTKVINIEINLQLLIFICFY